jgi:hypothetical protein
MYGAHLPADGCGTVMYGAHLPADGCGTVMYGVHLPADGWGTVMYHEHLPADGWGTVMYGAHLPADDCGTVICGAHLLFICFRIWFNWELCGKSIEPLFPKVPLVETLLIASLHPYYFSEKIRAIDVGYQGYLGRLGK